MPWEDEVEWGDPNPGNNGWAVLYVSLIMIGLIWVGLRVIL